MAELKDCGMRPLAEAEALYRRWIAHLDEEFRRQESPDRRAEIVRDELYELYMGRPHGGRTTTSLISETAMFVAQESLDPRNAAIDADYATDVDMEKYASRKPLIWFWRMFDRSPVGENLWLGFRFRCMLARHIFRHVGKGIRIYPGVTFRFGYGIALEDYCTLGRGAVIEDGEGELTIAQGTTVEAGARFGHRA